MWLLPRLREASAHFCPGLPRPKRACRTGAESRSRARSDPRDSGGHPSGAPQQADPRHGSEPSPDLNGPARWPQTRMADSCMPSEAPRRWGCSAAVLGPRGAEAPLVGMRFPGETLQVWCLVDVIQPHRELVLCRTAAKWRRGPPPPSRDPCCWTSMVSTPRSGHGWGPSMVSPKGSWAEGPGTRKDRSPCLWADMGSGHRVREEAAHSPLPAETFPLPPESFLLPAESFLLPAETLAGKLSGGAVAL